MIAAIADAMSRAISLPSREIEQIQLPRWRSTLQHVQRLLPHRVGTERAGPSGTGVRGMRTVDESGSISQATEPSRSPANDSLRDRFASTPS
jgi:hypothetical protein